MSDDPADDSPNEDDSSERDDPFDRLGYDTEREGDPFERLDDGTPVESSGQDTPSTGDPWGSPGEDERDPVASDARSGPDGGDSESAGVTDPVSSGVTDPDAVRSPTPEGSTGQAPGDDTGDPFADVETPGESPFGGSGSAFERVDSGGADPDQVWERITGEDDGADGDSEAMPDDGRYSEVSKHTFCERCEHFSPPPNVTCTHDTAEIIEFLDMETVRLLDCPVVAEREELEQD